VTALPSPEERDFGAALDALADEGQDPQAHWVAHLSGPTRDELARWQSVWPEISPERRQWIASTMLERAEMSFEVDFRPLFVSLLDDPDEAVRATAVDGLWEAEDVGVMDRYVALLRDDWAEDVRARAAAALGSYVLRAELDEIEPARVRGALRALLDAAADESEAVEVRRRATESAGYADTGAVHRVIEDAADAPERTLRAGALRAMGRSADRRWAPLVLRALEDRDPEIRFEAARAAGELALQDAVAALWGLAEQDEQEIQLEAIWSLGEIGGRDATRALERLAQGCDEPLVEAVEDALATAALSEGDLDWANFEPLLGDDEPWRDPWSIPEDDAPGRA
jgi:HEAT repeat protein